MKEIYVEYVNFSDMRSFVFGSLTNMNSLFNLCKNCKYKILVDELTNYIICGYKDIHHPYFKNISYCSEFKRIKKRKSKTFRASGLASSNVNERPDKSKII